MKQKSVFLVLFLLSVNTLMLFGFENNTLQNHFSERVKVSLRHVGNKLLLVNNDSTSLILPITKLNENHYEIAFQNKLSITPDSLVSIFGSSLKTSNLPKRYIVEVINCSRGEVSYSYQITGLKEQDIIPCIGRNLVRDCYTIQVLFLEDKSVLSQTKTYLILIFLFIGIIGFLFFYKKRKNKINVVNLENTYSKIGHYKFYKNQNKLIRDTVEIQLSTKECELMAMFCANQNQVIKREILVKEIWEDHGVFVDRSLYTFISKLRKKFKNDDSINITNVHGVGYKLEVK